MLIIHRRQPACGRTIPLKLMIPGIILALATLSPARTYAQGPAIDSGLEQFQSLLKNLGGAPADDCGWTETAAPGFSADTARTENKLFDAADSALSEVLNSAADEPGKSVIAVLEKMRATSENINHKWPAEYRFQSEVVLVQPAIVVKMTIRSRATFSVFAVRELPPTTSKPPTRAWATVGTDERRWGEHNSAEEMDIFALSRGPSERARFLSKSSRISCGDGQTGIEYIGYEWNPDGYGELREVLRRKGAVSGEIYPAIGRLSTGGPTITIPYCYWSALDESVWATLCSVDAYDLSTDNVRYLSTKANRPDLEAVARVIEYAQARDLRALLAYSGSEEVAKKMVALMPPSIFNGGSTFAEPQGARETVDIENSDHLCFFLQRRGGHWIVTRFVLNPTDPK